MCYDLDRFLEQDLACDLTCSICKGVLCCPSLNKKNPCSKQEPMNGHKGGHKFCEKCIINWLKIEKNCPDCRQNLSMQRLQGLDLFALNTLKKLKVRCKHYKNGCKHVDKFELVEKHEETCVVAEKVKLEESLKLNNFTELITLCDSAENNYERVKELIEKENANVNYSDTDGYTALIRASQWGHLNIVEYLVEKGANIEMKNNSNANALYWASKKGHIDIVEYLLKNAAD